MWELGRVGGWRPEGEQAQKIALFSPLCRKYRSCFSLRGTFFVEWLRFKAMADPKCAFRLL